MTKKQLLEQLEQVEDEAVFSYNGKKYKVTVKEIKGRVK